MRSNQIRRYHYLLTITVATLLGYLGGPLLARYLLGIITPGVSYLLLPNGSTGAWTALSLQVWTPTSRVLLILFFLTIGKQAHVNFESASKTVLSHTLAFYRWRDRICTPGTVLDYLVWAYTYAVVRGFTALASFIGLLIIPPFSLTQSWLWRVILLIPFLIFSLSVTGHVLKAIDDIYGEIPKKLGMDLQIFGHLMSYLQARDEEES